jgi:hypothetical protein
MNRFQVEPIPYSKSSKMVRVTSDAQLLCNLRKAA